MKLETPILFLIFNRPEVTEIVFEKIREVQPRALYIAADGPRKNIDYDNENCMRSRELVLSRIDWQCEVKTLFRDENLGCGKAVSEAITWFFNNVEQGIIIEDDVVADITFFRFCEELLNRYKKDERIMHISGLNVAGTSKNSIASYLFSLFGTVWGWATWKRAWAHYDLNIAKWNDIPTQEKILQLFPFEVKKNRKILYDDLYNKKIDTWDYQWTFARLLNSGLSIIPTQNLIKNIGCGSDGTHVNQTHPWANLNVVPLKFPLNHPRHVAVNESYDLFHLGVKR